jgi:hypothetical protein
MKSPRCISRTLAFALALAPALGAGAAPAATTELRALIGGIAAIAADNPEGVRLSVGYDESVAVLLPKDSPFIQGIEIEIKSPQAVIAAPGGFAYELWRDLSPEPDRKRLAYRGERIIMQPLPARAGYAIQIPVRADHTLRQGPYATLIPFIVEGRDFPFLFKLVPISKGLSAAAEAAKFQIRVRPLLSEAGALSLKLRYPDEGPERSPVTVTVDDRKVDPSAPIVLKPGSYRLGLSSESYRDESRQFVVEQGKTLELLIELQGTKPLVSIEAPDSAVLTVDGQRIDRALWASLSVEPGDHSATCRIGDYTLTRKFTAYRGKSYKLVLEIDLRVEEGQ